MRKLAFISATLPMCVAVCVWSSPARSASKCPQLSSSARSQALDRRARAGNGLAASCLASHLHSLDGGELEDGLRALGQYGDRRPAGLLTLAHRGVLSMLSLADAVSMLPLSMSDDMDGQTVAMRARHDRYSRAGEPMLARERSTALRSIDSAVAKIRAHAFDR